MGVQSCWYVSPGPLCRHSPQGGAGGLHPQEPYLRGNWQAALVSSLPLLGASRSLEVTRATAKLGVQPREWPWEGGVKFTCRFRTCLIQRGPKPAGKFVPGDFEPSSLAREEEAALTRSKPPSMWRPRHVRFN